MSVLEGQYRRVPRETTRGLSLGRREFSGRGRLDTGTPLEIRVGRRSQTWS